MTSEPEFTAEQITEAIAVAIKAQAFKVVPGLIRLLALQDPHQAQIVYDSLTAVLDSSSGSGSAT